MYTTVDHARVGLTPARPQWNTLVVCSWYSILPSPLSILPSSLNSTYISSCSTRRHWKVELVMCGTSPCLVSKGGGDKQFSMETKKHCSHVLLLVQDQPALLLRKPLVLPAALPPLPSLPPCPFSHKILYYLPFLLYSEIVGDSDPVQSGKDNFACIFIKSHTHECATLAQNSYIDLVGGAG